DEVWTIRTSVTKDNILAYFNSGVIFSSAESRLFEKWLNNFRRLAKDIRVYHLKYMEFYLLEQALLSGTILKYFSKKKIKILSNHYNYPLPFHNQLKDTIPYAEIKILHYFELLKTSYLEELSEFPQPTMNILNLHLPLKTY